MPCKKSELITAINSFAAARVSDDQVLTGFSANLVAKLLETLVFDAEDEKEEEVTAEVDNTAETEKVTTEQEAAPEETKAKAPVLKDPPVKKTKRRTAAKV